MNILVEFIKYFVDFLENINDYKSVALPTELCWHQRLRLYNIEFLLPIKIFQFSHNTCQRVRLFLRSAGEITVFLFSVLL